jgi:16S rRNA (cytosine967-C5)-methyltransferase
MGLSPARVVAREVITKVRERDAYAHETMNLALHRHKLKPEDAAFATRLAYGTIACRGTVDEIVAARLKSPKKTDPRVLDALALATYELIFEKSEAYAAVSQGVEVVRSLEPRQAALVNAVLRRIADSRRGFPWGDAASDERVHARLHGHPLWLAHELRSVYGYERADSIMRTNNEPAPLYVACMPFRTSFSAAFNTLTTAGTRPVAYPLDGCIEIGKPSSAVASTLLADRSIAVIDACAQLAVALAQPRAGQHIVEIGSGRGTKTLLLAGLARDGENTATVTGVDLYDYKNDILARDAARLHVNEVKTLTCDATQPGFAQALAGVDALPQDMVFVDAPCSGLGTLRRHPDRRWRMKPSEIDQMAALGGALLRSAATVVRRGGMVVYSTCTISTAENTAVVADFLAAPQGRDFELVPVQDHEVPQQLAAFVRADGTFQSLPESGGPDGHFVARLVKKN